MMDGKITNMEEGRTEAYELFYREYFLKIYRYAFRFIGNSQEAEQLTQESFARLFDLLSNGSEVRNPKLLVYRIAHNICINSIKRQKTFGKIISRHKDLLTSSATSEEELSHEEMRAALVRNGLLRLRPRDQRCLFLYQDGFSYAEIAEAIGINKNSIGKILARALERLSREIQRGKSNEPSE
jgi:RNA polymerase sigma-70 factor (ECF subfamily)